MSFPTIIFIAAYILVMWANYKYIKSLKKMISINESLLTKQEAVIGSLRTLVDAEHECYLEASLRNYFLILKLTDEKPLKIFANKNLDYKKAKMEEICNIATDMTIDGTTRIAKMKDAILAIY